MSLILRTRKCAATYGLFVVFALYFSICSVGQAFSRPIPTNIPRNKLSEADATYLLQKDKNKIWLNSELETYQLTKHLAALNTQQLSKAPFAPVILRGSELRREVAFSFDDGPHAAFTPDLIQILMKYHIPATMFLVGTQAERYPYLVKDEVAAGLTIGNHTYHHFSLTKIPPDYIGPELRGCGDVLKQITGKTPTLFRPPGGDYSPDVSRIAAQLGYTTVLWTVDPGDFNKPAASVILARTLSKVSNGTILLFHDGIPQTMEALPLIIDYLKINGYQIVSIDQMLKERSADQEMYNNSLKMAKFAEDHQQIPAPSIDQFNSKE